jgi:hypothetical protein
MIAPLTCSFPSGAFVPIPKLPVPVIRARSVLFVPRTKLVLAKDPMAISPVTGYMKVLPALFKLKLELAAVDP